jgi:flagellar basal-body rod protein FlgB
MKIFNIQYANTLKRSLDVLMRHNRNISENVSNINTPNYRRKPTRFLDELMLMERQTILKTTNPRHIVPEPSDIDAPEWEQGPVEITREMSDLALNQIRYDFSTRVLRRRFDGLVESITGHMR